MSNQTSVYVCEVCGKSFSSRQALGGHVTGHRGEVKSLTDGSFAGELVKARRELVATFRPRINELDRKIEEAEAVVDALKSQRREVEAQLRKLDPDATTPGPKPKSKAVIAMGTGARDNAAKLDATRAFLGKRKRTLGEFTGEVLHREMKDAGVTPLPSAGKVREFLPTLQGEGIIRAHKVTRGGGMSYAIIGANGASAGDE